MAGYARDNIDQPRDQALAYDIETSQTVQIGEMQGWLDSLGIVARQHGIRWPGWPGTLTCEANGLMPGMATPAQMTTLETLHGKALDILFLQLMIHHHQGGVTMAQYAAAARDAALRAQPGADDVRRRRAPRSCRWSRRCAASAARRCRRRRTERSP